MNLVHFHIEYVTYYGQNIMLTYHKSKGRKRKSGEIILQTYDGKNWLGNLALEEGEKLAYRYTCATLLHTEEEAEGYRTIKYEASRNQVYLKDFWRNPARNENIFYSSAFRDVFFHRKTNKRLTNVVSQDNLISFSLNAPDIPTNRVVGITGMGKQLGDWGNPIIMNYQEDQRWEAHIQVERIDVSLEYKYVLCNENGQIQTWEEGDNRSIGFNFPSKENSSLIIHDEGYRHSSQWWKAAGMAIPVFSLRSKSGLGIGEFLDLKLAIDFCHNSGLKVLQILPINDSIASYTYKDSYPYAAISVYALNPLYIHVASIASFKNKTDHKAYRQALEDLNELAEIDLLKVEKHKLNFLKILYIENREDVFKSKSYQTFFTNNKKWLIHYACFCYLRDHFGTANFNTWGKYQVFNNKLIEELLEKNQEEIGFYYFCQYFADKQLKSVKKYGQLKEVVLKGDLPIGIFRYSCDAWVGSNLYNMDQQAGAPPDGYAELGQNWGFPTYDWDTMAKDNFSWWQNRMKKLAEYFDAMRIDHILGFFRIWQIPMEQVYGTMGLFNPRLPYSRYELSYYGMHGDLDRYIHPFIREYMLDELFGQDKDFVITQFLEEPWTDIFILKNKYKTQKLIAEAFQENKFLKKYQHLKAGVMHLPTEILLIAESEGQEVKYNPRITLQTTYSYAALNEHEKGQFTALYNHYYYERHNEYWKQQALWKLPALLSATDMLICGEDLGMIPATVPEIMEKLNIITLEIQRMPKGSNTFGQPKYYNYYSVCSPSCHDMSTIRGWWEEDRDNRQLFWSQHWRRAGEAPEVATTEIVEKINWEHFLSPSILAIFPLQDLVGMDMKLRRTDVCSEQINDPGNSEQYWNYRFHMTLENLNKEEELIRKIRNMVNKSNR